MLRNNNLIKRLIMSYNRILKFQSGGKYFATDLEEAGNRAFGQPLYYDKRTGDLVQIPSKTSLNRDGWSIGKVVRTGKEMQNGPYNVFNITGWVPIYAYKGTSQGRQKQSNEIEVNGKKYASVSDWHKKRAAKQQTPTVDVVTTKTDRTGKVNNRINRNINRPDYAKNFANFQFSPEEIAYMKSLNYDPTDARSVQEFILSKSGQIDLGSRKGIGTADGLWGNKSIAAFKALREQGIFTPKADEQEKPVVEQPLVDAPDPFGYKTVNTYEDDDFASKLKRMGIRSNADLINFMYKSGKEGWQGDEWSTQFRSDVDRALGGDYSDTNIRKVFNTQGNWGKGFMGRGDYGDFQNALQTNAGVWNGIYDAKQNEARMDTARQQYAAKLAQQFTPQLSKPTIEYPSNRFMINKIQTNTLPSLSKEWAGFDGLV